MYPHVSAADGFDPDTLRFPRPPNPVRARRRDTPSLWPDRGGVSGRPGLGHCRKACGACSDTVQRSILQLATFGLELEQRSASHDLPPQAQAKQRPRPNLDLPSHHKCSWQTGEDGDGLSSPSNHSTSTPSCDRIKTRHLRLRRSRRVPHAPSRRHRCDSLQWRRDGIGWQTEVMATISGKDRIRRRPAKRYTTKPPAVVALDPHSASLDPRGRGRAGRKSN